jgi:uncharacterized protein YbdZ (MbtH family)
MIITSGEWNEWDVSRKGELRNACRNFVETWNKNAAKSPTRECEENVKRDVQNIFEGVNLIHLAQSRDGWLDFVNTVMKFLKSEIARTLLSRWETVHFWRRTWLHGGGFWAWVTHVVHFFRFSNYISMDFPSLLCRMYVLPILFYFTW